MRKLRYAFIIIVGLFFYTTFIASSVRYIKFSPSGGKKWLGFMAPTLAWMAEIPFKFKEQKKIIEFKNPILIADTSNLQDGFT